MRQTKYVGKHRVVRPKNRMKRSVLAAACAAYPSYYSVAHAFPTEVPDDPTISGELPILTEVESDYFYVPTPRAHGEGPDWEEYLRNQAAWEAAGKPVAETPVDAKNGGGEPVESAALVVPNGPEPQSTPPAVPVPPSYGQCWFGDGQTQLGLTPNADRVYRAVCANFPQIPEYGGLRPGDPLDHGAGNAVDAMVYQDTATGDAVAAFLVANADELNIKYVIWKQQIWQNVDGLRYWSGMEDRGSATQNHYDHVHISVW